MTHIGIDPAFRENGFSIAWVLNSTMNFRTFKSGFLDFILFMRVQFPDFKSVVITIENSNLQNTTFDKRGSPGVVAKKSRNVGANQAISQCTVDYCNVHYAHVYEISPLAKGPKLNQEIFNELLKQQGIKPAKARVNQDCRDAGQLALIGMKRADWLLD